MKVKPLTEKEAALSSPLELKKPGSVDWCWQILFVVKHMWNSKIRSETRWIEILRELEEYHVWDVVPPEKPYGSLDALLKAEIGVAAEESTQIVKLRANGGDRKSGNYQAYNISLKQYGTAAQYLTARLERDHPAIHERMKRGEYKSVRAAAKEAGLVRDEIRVLRDPHLAARALKRAFNRAEINMLIKALSEDTK
jgi:hypothetical protein